MQGILDLESNIRLNKEHIKSLQKDNNRLKNILHQERRVLVDKYISRQEILTNFTIPDCLNGFSIKNTECPSCIDESGVCNACRSGI